MRDLARVHRQNNLKESKRGKEYKNQKMEKIIQKVTFCNIKIGKLLGRLPKQRDDNIHTGNQNITMSHAP